MYYKIIQPIRPITRLIKKLQKIQSVRQIVLKDRLQDLLNCMKPI